MALTAQSAYQVGHGAGSDDVDADVAAAMRLYMEADLGLGADVAARRAHAEQARDIPKAVLRALAASAIEVRDRAVLDLGAGLGAMSEELLLAGARVHALEPGEAWARLTQRRLCRHGREFKLIKAYGESIPLPDQCVDLVVSLQVLEHVARPAQVLAEAWRVLRPGGSFYLVCENYLAFWEPHYQVPWLPLLPKPIGRLYLSAIGRPTGFLDESITYVTFPGILRECRRIGFVRARDTELRAKLASGQGFRWALMRLLARAAGGALAQALDDARHYCAVGVYELFHKPEAPAAAHGEADRRL